MFKRNCRCGKTQKTFKRDIGPFYIDECCTLAGYDHNGDKVGEETPVDPPKQPENDQVNQILNDPFSSNPVETSNGTTPPDDQTKALEGKAKRLSDRTLNELKDLAKLMKLKNFKSLRKKSDLIALIEKAQESND